MTRLQRLELLELLEIAKNTPPRFEVGNKVELLKKGKSIQKGVVVEGPFLSEGYTYYLIKWESAVPEYYGSIGSTSRMVDLPNKKFRLELSE